MVNNTPFWKPIQGLVHVLVVEVTNVQEKERKKDCQIMIPGFLLLQESSSILLGTVNTYG